MSFLNTIIKNTMSVVFPVSCLRCGNRAERMKNIVGSFVIKDTKTYLIKNRNITLIDDILTIGATLNEAKKTLK